MNKKQKKFVDIITIVLAIFGIVTLSAICHEKIHEIDFGEVVQNGEICILDLDSYIGYFQYSYSASESNAVGDIEKYTELKAYPPSIILAVLLGLCVYYSFKKEDTWLKPKGL